MGIQPQEDCKLSGYHTELPKPLRVLSADPCFVIKPTDMQEQTHTATAQGKIDRRKIYLSLCLKKKSL